MTNFPCPAVVFDGSTADNTCFWKALIKGTMYLTVAKTAVSPRYNTPSLEAGVSSEGG